MRQTGATPKLKHLDEFDRMGNGPRPPVPGAEKRYTEMTDCVRPTGPPSELDRVEKWKKGLEYLLSDEKGSKLFYQYLDLEAGSDNINIKYLEFYFACEGLKLTKPPFNDGTIRLIGCIYK